MARSYSPGTLIVDQSVTGRYENYFTPEQEVPEKPLNYLWETCMTMQVRGRRRPFSFRNHPYETSQPDVCSGASDQYLEVTRLNHSLHLPIQHAQLVEPKIK